MSPVRNVVGGLETKAQQFGYETKEAQSGHDSSSGLGELQNEVKQFTVDLKTLRNESLIAWEQFKLENDKRIAAIEAKQSVDPLLEEKIAKIGKDVLAQQERADQLSTALTRLNQASPPAHERDQYAQARQFFQLCMSRRNPAMRVRPDDIDLRAYEDYKSAWGLYLAKDREMLSPEEYKAMSVGSDPDGGYLVTPEMSSRIIMRVFETSPMRQLATVETIGTMALELLVDKDEIASGWVGETQPRPQTGTPQWAKKQIVVHEIYANPAATQTVLDDANRDLEAWLQAKVAEKFARDEATAFITGAGVNTPRGILTYPAGTAWGQVAQINSGHATAIMSDAIINMTYALKEPYYGNATFLMNRRTIGKVMLLKDGQNNYLWQPNYQSGQPATLAGYPVRFANDMPDIAASALPVAFGDFRAAYTVVDRIGIRVLRDPYTNKPYVHFYTTRRVGGDVVNTEAYCLMVIAL